MNLEDYSNQELIDALMRNCLELGMYEVTASGDEHREASVVVELLKDEVGRRLCGRYQQAEGIKK